MYVWTIQEKDFGKIQKDRVSGKPGLFLTGSIPQRDIKKINLTGDNNVVFISNKILWFPHGKLVNSPYKLSSLSDYRKNELAGIFQELKNKGEEISTHVIEILTRRSLIEKVLLTIRIKYKDDKDPKFVGQITDYVEFFKKGVLSKKYKTKKQEVGELLVCSVCNKQSLIYPFAESPLPFFFSKKTHFFDNDNIAKGFPLCGACYIELQKGMNFIQSNLDYHISSTQLDKKRTMRDANIKFLLIPELENYELLERFKADLRRNNLYYLNTLKELCSTLKTISSWDYPKEGDNIESFLRFSALFYTNDKEAYNAMRVLNYTQGIYPSQLETLLKIKERIDKLYPYQHIKQEEFFVGLPLLVTFYKGIKPQWQAQIISVLNRLFTGQQIPIEEIIQNIRIRIHESLRESKDLEVISRISFMGLMLLEYIISLNESELNIQHTDSSNNEVMMLNISTYEIKHTEKFIERHKSILTDGTRRGIFATGVAVAILLFEQEDKYRKTPPFWDKLKRLDLNLNDVIEYLPKVQTLLAMYKIKYYDKFINYLGAKYVIDCSVSIPKEWVSYLFTIGLSFGYFLSRKSLKDQDGEEVE